MSKLQRLKDLFQEMQSVIVAFSGGIDSTVVYRIASDTLGGRALAVTAVSPTLPAIELDVARRVASEIGGKHLVVETDQLEMPEFARNDASRCYHCKTDLYRALQSLRKTHGMNTVADGTNLDDLGDDRPGIRAAQEYGVRSPLVEANISKDEVRELARQLGLSNWDKPAAACLSSRIPRGVAITLEKLGRVEQAEALLFSEGFRLVRVRHQNDQARIELDPEEFHRILEPGRRERILEGLKAAGFTFVTLDLQGYRQGSTNKT